MTNFSCSISNSEGYYESVFVLDLASKLDESHMPKHLQNSHGGIGEPEFKFQVFKYCRSALDSKAGYNRSGVARLSLRPEEMIPTRRKEDVDEGVQQGLARMVKEQLRKQRQRTD